VWLRLQGDGATTTHLSYPSPPSLPLFLLLTSPTAEQRLGGKESSNGEEAKLEKAAGVLSGQGVKETRSSVDQGLSPSQSSAVKARRGGAGKLGVWDLPGAKLWFRGGLKAHDPLGVRAIPRLACQ
jgi:hypothetical protein